MLADLDIAVGFIQTHFYYHFHGDTILNKNIMHVKDLPSNVIISILEVYKY
jgi:hypothetical protein